MRWCLPLTALVALLASVLAACGLGADYWEFRSEQATGSGTTTLLIYFSDSPADGAERLWVALDEISLLGADGDQALLSERRELDVLTLQNGRRATLAEVEVPAGSYTGLRVRFAPEATERNRVEIGGASHVLHFLGTDAATRVASHPLVLAASGRTELQIDLDARTSLHAAGTAYHLDPRLDFVDLATAGTISGRTAGPTGTPVAAVLSLQQGGEEVRSTRSDADGTFALGPLRPGMYALVATAAGHTTASVPSVTVSADSDTPADVLLSPATQGEVAGTVAGATTGWSVRVRDGGLLVAWADVDPATGAYTLPALAPGVYDVELTDGGTVLDTVLGVSVTSAATTPVLFP